MTPIRQQGDRRRVSQAVASLLLRLEPGNPKLNLPQVNPIYSITMPDRRHPQFEQDWRDSLWAMVILFAILLLRYLTRR